METRLIMFLAVVLIAQIASVAGLGLMDLFFASLDKNRDNLLSVNEVQQLNWCVVYPHHFGDFLSMIWKSAESNKGLSLSEWRDMRFTADEIEALTKPFVDVAIVY